MVARARTIMDLLKRRPRLSATVFLLIIALIPATLWLIAQEPLPPMHEIFPAGAIRIAVDASFPPFARATDSGLEGIDIEIGNELSKRLGMPVHFINMGYDGLYDSLTKGDADITLSALLVDKMRLGDVFYSHSYFDAGLVAISANDNPLHKMEDLPGRALAYEFGSAADAEARLWSRRIAPFEHLPYELPEHAMDAVRLGQADAALVDRVSAMLYLRQYPEWEARYISVTFAPYAIAVRLDRRHVLTVVNRALIDMMKDGTLETIIKDWL